MHYLSLHPVPAQSVLLCVLWLGAICIALNALYRGYRRSKFIWSVYHRIENQKRLRGLSVASQDDPIEWWDGL